MTSWRSTDAAPSLRPRLSTNAFGHMATDLASANYSATYREEGIVCGASSLPCLFARAPMLMLIRSTDISFGQPSLLTIKVRRAGKDVFRGSLARMPTKKHSFIHSFIHSVKSNNKHDIHHPWLQQNTEWRHSGTDLPRCSGKRPLNEVSSPLLLTQLFIMDARSAMRPCYILPILLNGSSRNFHTW